MGTSKSSDSSRDRDVNGVVNGDERCGTSCGEEPTSGELQYQDGCEQGYIPAPECRPRGCGPRAAGTPAVERVLAGPRFQVRSVPSSVVAGAGPAAQ